MAGAEQVVLDAQDGDNHQPVRKRARCGGAVDGAIYLVENGWKVVEKARNLVLMGGSDQAVLKQYRGVVALSCITACLLMLPMKIWEILSGIVNRNMTCADSLDSRRKPTSPEEMIGFYGVVIEMENTYGNNTKNWKKHFGMVKESGILVPGLGCDRFMLIKNALVPTIEELRDITKLMSNAACALTEAVSVCVIDESVVKYQPSGKTKQEAAEH
jgi:hypothetical protein